MGIRPTSAVLAGDDSSGPLALKLCPLCDQLKPTSDFYQLRNRGDGFSRACKLCKPQPSPARPPRSARQRRRRALATLRQRWEAGKKVYRSKYNPQGKTPLELLEGRIS